MDIDLGEVIDPDSIAVAVERDVCEHGVTSFIHLVCEWEDDDEYDTEPMSIIMTVNDAASVGQALLDAAIANGGVVRDA